MANTKSAAKMTRKIATRTAINKSRRSRVRTFMRRFEDAVASGEAETARAAFVSAESELMKAAQHGILHRNTASRTISRFSTRVKALSA